ncbi:hypothetical protein CP03DC29_0266B, partial [Chlamydia psittaci 03DC29]
AVFVQEYSYEEGEHRNS